MNVTVELLHDEEIPQIVWPKGPIRRIRSLLPVRDALAGDIIVATLEVCGHEAHLVSTATITNLVRCAKCFYQKRGE